MTIIILTILAVIASSIGLVCLCKDAHGATVEIVTMEKTSQMCEGMGFLLMGIFLLLLALLFKQNPFW